MIQNTTPANQPAQPNPMARPNQEEDFIRIQDLLYLCLTQWRWFILSLVVTCGIATYYNLTTPNVYQRTASLMIKDESKAQGIGVHFKNDESGIEARRKIEALLGGVMKSSRATHTM